MAANKYIALVSGRLRETAATVTSSGAGDDGKIVALNSSGRLDNSVMPVGIGEDTKVLPATENLSAGNLVNIWSNAGTFGVRKADATVAGKEAHGFVLTSVTSGQDASVYLEGTITGLTGLSSGRYYLSTTAGEATPVPPTASGAVVQYIGSAVSATEITFEPADGVILA